VNNFVLHPVSAFSVMKVGFSAIPFTFSLCLPVGIGLLRLRWGCRKLALMHVWLGCMFLFCLEYQSLSGNGPFLRSFPPRLGISDIFLVNTFFLLALAAFLFWIHKVLRRTEIKLLFENQKGIGKARVEVGIAVLLVIMTVFEEGSHQKGQGMSNSSPSALRFLPTAEVIQAGMKDVKSAWAWNELRDRERAGRISQLEAVEIIDELTSWIQREYPSGYDEPTFWFGDLLKYLNTDHLLPETNVLAYLVACCGTPSIEQLPRVRQNTSNLNLQCKWRMPYYNPSSLGFELLNEMSAISIDGEAVQVKNSNNNMGKSWGDYSNSINISNLGRGKHKIRCEIKSSLVDPGDLAGFADNTPSSDWPPSKYLWNRTAEAEFTVYSKDEILVNLTEDASLDPSADLSVEDILIRNQNGALKAVVSIKKEPNPEQPLSVDVTLHLSRRSYECGTLFIVGRHTSLGSIATYRSSSPKVVDISALETNVTEAEIVLTPNPSAVESFAEVDRIWGKPIVISHIPLKRYDLQRENKN
jgi:hypothetical protein